MALVSAYFNLIVVIVPDNFYMVFLDRELKEQWTFWRNKQEDQKTPGLFKNENGVGYASRRIARKLYLSSTKSEIESLNNGHQEKNRRGGANSGIHY